MARFEFAALLWGSACFVAPSSAQTTAGALLELRATPDGTALSFRPGEPFHTTDREVVDPRDVSVAGSGVAVARWGERADEDAPVEPWYAIAFADGRTRVTSTDYTVRLRHGGGFDPLEGPPAFYVRSPLRASTSVYLVQYETQPLGVYQDRIRELGGRVSGYLPHHVNLVRLSEAALERVRGEPFVRAVLPFHAEYRVDRFGSTSMQSCRSERIPRQ
jgi:hypothetical protein